MKPLRVAILVLTLIAVSHVNAAEPYRLGVGDQVEFSVWRDPDLTRTLEIPPDGVVSFPLVGDVKAAGLSVPEVRAILIEKLRPFVTDTPVSVLLLQPKSLIAYVVGKVNRPGQFQISNNTTVIQALAMAGGPTPFAETKEILILRRSGDDTVTLPFSYDQVSAGKSLKQNIVLYRGDVVVVP